MDIKLIQGDCLEEMKNIPDGSIDLVLTDPPYGMKYKRHIKEPRFDYLLNYEGLEWLPEFCDELGRIMKDDSNFYIFCSWHNVGVFQFELGKHFHLKNLLVWDNGGSGMGDLRTDYGGRYELVFFGVNKKVKQKALNGKRDSNVISFGRSGNKLHPTEKPVDLIEYLTFKSSSECDIVCDPFMGSGTTGVACKNLNRNFIGIELDKDYYEIAKQRIGE
jgi:site-specific DNA-methyltransferase (adenine-specific)